MVPIGGLISLSAAPAGGSHVGIQEKQVGVFAATRWELNALRRALSVEEARSAPGARCVIGRRGGWRVFLFQTGIGIEAAQGVCRRAFAGQSFDLAVSSGFACALTAADVGDLLIGTEVLLGGYPDGQTASDRVLRCSPDLAAAAARAAQGAGLVARSGRLVTVPHVLCRAYEKREVAASAGAIGLDMESAAICEVAIEQGVPVVVARTVSDLVDEDLPVDFNLFLDRSGWTRGVLSCLTHPAAWSGLNRLRVQAGVSAERLTRFFGPFLDELG